MSLSRLGSAVSSAVTYGGVCSLLVLESGVVGSVGERDVGCCASGVGSVVCGQPGQRALRLSGATAPTMIRKRNIVPVHPERR